MFESNYSRIEIVYECININFSKCCLNRTIVGLKYLMLSSMNDLSNGLNRTIVGLKLEDRINKAIFVMREFESNYSRIEMT
ncbi:protein of unknown function [Candidatus Nitrosocaldus cavascurensis]|uniref:Uncharacterized protein n=1 Tax=Candidatus Nitrosocaldus cavascurensis TaxID=2058097 RepID=A0A2K5ATH3_9ARCH|nr:protein of unknown function [Candidatus Nitrosocaldus cavascurensis]